MATRGLPDLPWEFVPHFSLTGRCHWSNIANSTCTAGTQQSRGFSWCPEVLDVQAVFRGSVRGFVSTLAFGELPKGKPAFGNALGSCGLKQLDGRVVPTSVGLWSSTGSMTNGRFYDGATLLQNGMVLVAGGSGGTSGFLSSAELYNPITQIWSSAGNMNVATSAATQSLMGNGDVLVAGGFNTSSTAIATAQIYDPAHNTWSLTASMAQPRQTATALTLANGKVLVVGGSNPNNSVGNQQLSSAELFDPASAHTWLLRGTDVTATEVIPRRHCSRTAPCLSRADLTWFLRPARKSTTRQLINGLG